MMALELQEETAPPRRGGPAPGDANATRVALPPKLLLAIMEVLEARGHKRTLLDFLLTSRSVLSVGLSVLFRQIKVSRGSSGALDRLRGLVADALGTGKLTRAKELSVDIWTSDPFYAELLRGTGASLQELRITASSGPGVLSFLETVGSLRKLKRVSISLDYSDRPRIADAAPRRGVRLCSFAGFAALDVSTKSSTALAHTIVPLDSLL
ncbi:hypothetical protein DFJ74DRAFT_500391 [Hyaloraphidium curvatum]|nr:hypothetical protein DFJ74DRAFT_500391 [Hyaloraphidium curvatum]